VVAAGGTPEYQKAIGEAEYLVGFVDMLIKEELYKAAPKLKLIQLLSAGYDRADLAAARKHKVRSPTTAARTRPRCRSTR